MDNFLIITNRIIGRLYGTSVAAEYQRTPSGSRCLSSTTGMTPVNVWGIPQNGIPRNGSCFVLPIQDGLGIIKAGIRGVGQILSSLHATGKGIVTALNNIRGVGTLTKGNLAEGRNLVCSMDGLGEIVVNHATGKAALSIEISIGSKPTAFDITQAVWNALTASYAVPGSMGKALTDAGSAGNPWSSVAADNNVTGTMGALANDLLDDAQGKGVIDSVANTLTLYRRDGITVLKTFTLTEGPAKTYIART